MRSIQTSLGIGLATLAVVLFVPSASAVQGSVKIEQISPEKIGEWTLLTATGTPQKSTDPGVNQANYSFTITEVGPVTLSVVTPAGLSSHILVYRNGTLERETPTQQVSFTLYPNDNYRFVIQYSKNKNGMMGITTDPTPLLFRVKGPDGRTLRGTSPKTFTEIPTGRYSIYVSPTAGCAAPPVKTVQVEEEKRLAVHISVPCDTTSKNDTTYQRGPTKRSIISSVINRQIQSTMSRRQLLNSLPKEQQ